MENQKQVYKNKNYVKRNYECTNLIACVANEAPDDNWILSDNEILKNLTKLYKEKNVVYFGHL